MNTYPTLTLHRSELVARHACEEGLALFDDVCTLGGTGDELTFELSPLAVLWLARDAPDVLAWLRGEGFCTVDLTGADLTGADLRGALRDETDPPIVAGWTLHNGRLQRSTQEG